MTNEMPRLTLTPELNVKPEEQAEVQSAEAQVEAVKKEIRKAERKNTNLFILESALLIDDDYDEICDEIWYVHVDAEIRKKRLMFARGYTAKRVDNIIASQMKKKEYLMNCDRVIVNSGVFLETTMQLDQIIKDL